MKIINVVTILNNQVNWIESFIVHEPQLEDDVTRAAEDCYVQTINEIVPEDKRVEIGTVEDWDDYTYTYEEYGKEWRVSIVDSYGD